MLGALSETQLALAVTLLIIVGVVRELFFSPLRAFPGPVVARFTNFWRAFLTTRGNVDSVTRGWHQKWGTAVRIGPNAISLSDPSLIRVVYASTSKNAWRKVRSHPDLFVERQAQAQAPTKMISPTGRSGKELLSPAKLVLMNVH